MIFSSQLLPGTSSYQNAFNTAPLPVLLALLFSGNLHAPKLKNTDEHKKKKLLKRYLQEKQNQYKDFLENYGQLPTSHKIIA